MPNIDMSQMLSASAAATAELDAEKARAHEALLAALNGFAAQLTGPVPWAEMQSWDAKETAARAINAGGSDPLHIALLAAETVQTGETQAALVARIISNSDAYRAAAGTIAGLRRKYAAQIDAATDAPGVAAALTGVMADLAALAI